ncbi:DUF6169 family protein [Mucilaginibacter psychrotolerans]|uniref:Uncharacterized protein n=1 Tax=Mucilaginibacter psychrotolerans TaxID=1524096 RepID=A0A4Y8RXF3_9SPHI|nr:DUF6169 family protein [Mucilaginibacter psychrotolerans]TFF30343.1 hypothetical protein E2R66_27685 [Mucilaginibacter psychrotolerans]
MDPLTEGEFVDARSFGFECVRKNPNKRQRYDVGTKSTILNILTNFFDKRSEDAFIYICLNTDGFARNRRIIFGRWFNELKSEYERHQSHIDYAEQGWYSALLIRKDNPSKQRYIDAFHYTQKRMLEDIENEEDD